MSDDELKALVTEKTGLHPDSFRIVRRTEVEQDGVTTIEVNIVQLDQLPRVPTQDGTMAAHHARVAAEGTRIRAQVAQTRQDIASGVRPPGGKFRL